MLKIKMDKFIFIFYWSKKRVKTKEELLFQSAHHVRDLIFAKSLYLTVLVRLGRQIRKGLNVMPHISKFV